MHSISFQSFLYRHFKLSLTLENSVCYCYTSYEMIDQCSSSQLHPCHRLFDQDGTQDSTLTLPIVQTLLLVTFAYSLNPEAVVRQLRR